MKWEILAIAGLVIVSMLVSPAIAQATTISIEDVEVAPGGSATVPIYIYDVTDPDGVGTVQLDLLYNASVVQITGTDDSNTDFSFVTPNIDNTNGIFTVGGTYMGAAPGPTGDVRVIDVTFTAVGSAGEESLLDITNTLLMDATVQQNDITHDVDDGTFTITGEADEEDPTVTVTAPNGGESWTVGTSHDTTWTATDNVGVTAIDIYYSTDGGATYPNTIATGEANDGTYTWTVPNTPSTTCIVKVVAHDAAGNTDEDVSDADFTITEVADEEDPTVTVTAPNGGDSWTVGTSQDITWTATDNVGVTAIDICYSTDGGATYPNTIATGQTNDGTYTWTVPNTPSTTCRVKVVAHDAALNKDEDASDVNFTIKAEARRVSGGGGGGAPRDTDGDGYSDIQEMLADTDENDPCDPDPECAACLASKPAATPTPTPTPTVTAKPTATPVPTPMATPTPTPTPTPPGFEAVFAITGLLAVAYLVLRKKRK